MWSVIALVGRPNVGKSTLFNRLTRRRDALVADAPGLTRDRRYGVAEFGERACTLIDTGGLFDETAVGRLMAQTSGGCDRRSRPRVVRRRRARRFDADRPRHRRAVAAEQSQRSCSSINKIDGAATDVADAEFSRLGFARAGADIRRAWPRHGDVGDGGARRSCRRKSEEPPDERRRPASGCASR